MSLATTITFDDPRKYPPLLRLAAYIKDPNTRKVMGRGVATELRKHFSRLDEQRPNKLGGKRTHFWGQVRRSVQQPELVGGDGLKIAINHVAAAQKYFGGDIEPVDADWLTLPARAESYAHRAREFDDLHFVLFRSSLAALVQNEQTSLGGRVHGSVTEKGRTKGETTGGGIFYWLVKHVHQDPDETVLQPETSGGVTLQQAALTAGEEYVHTLVQRAEDGTS